MLPELMYRAMFGEGSPGSGEWPAYERIVLHSPIQTSILPSLSNAEAKPHGHEESVI
jgi:hypothetical protein